ncbi:MAG: hypothetical protein GX424_06340 [Clostridiales bacterium]|jgi:hypothetical protein|nr:hypothetical protein [Clostridiales bacterium]
MARITDIRPCGRMIHAKTKTVMDINYNQKLFSIWVYAAGQESGVEPSRLSIQLDRDMAKRLRNALDAFIGETP